MPQGYAPPLPVFKRLNISENTLDHDIIVHYFMPSTFNIVKLPLALANIFNWTEYIMAQSHDEAKNPYCGLNIDFWHCLIVMTYRNRALFLNGTRLGYSLQHS